jgi:hypothetical protein
MVQLSVQSADENDVDILPAQGIRYFYGRINRLSGRFLPSMLVAKSEYPAF